MYIYIHICICKYISRICVIRDKRELGARAHTYIHAHTHVRTRNLSLPHSHIGACTHAQGRTHVQIFAQ